MEPLVEVHNGDLCQLDMLGRSAIFYLGLLNDSYEVDVYVIDHVCDNMGFDALNARDWDSRTALKYAARRGAAYMLDVLLSRGADPYTASGDDSRNFDSGVVHILRGYQFANPKPAMQLSVPKMDMVTRFRLQRQYRWSLGELAANVGSGPRKGIITLADFMAHTTTTNNLEWIHCPLTNVSL